MSQQSNRIDRIVGAIEELRQSIDTLTVAMLLHPIYLGAEPEDVERAWVRVELIRTWQVSVHEKGAPSHN
jgi:hypothetical protein